MIAARFKVVRAGAATVLRPLADGDEGLFTGEPSGSLQLGNLSDDGTALLAADAEVRICILPAGDGPQRLCPVDSMPMTAQQWADAILFVDATAKARAQELLAQALPTLEERLAALRREVASLVINNPPTGALFGPQALAQLELAWLAIRRAEGAISLDDPPAPAGNPPG